MRGDVLVFREASSGKHLSSELLHFADQEGEEEEGVPREGVPMIWTIIVREGMI